MSFECEYLKKDKLLLAMALTILKTQLNLQVSYLGQLQ